MSFISGRAGIPGAVEEANLLTFIRENWTNFPVMKMLPPTNKSDAVLQLFKPNDHIAGWFAGQYYCGLRFTVPEWLDGDLEVAFVHRYRSTKELNTRPGYGWGITAEREYFFGMGPVKRIPFKDLPEMRARYPFTEKAYAGRVDQRALVPGKTYVYWWAFSWSREEGVMPDMDVALTIVSPRGRKDYGEILWR